MSSVANFVLYLWCKFNSENGAWVLRNIMAHKVIGQSSWFTASPLVRTIFYIILLGKKCDTCDVQCCYLCFILLGKKIVLFY